jgi:hypothetical protein
MQQSLNNILVQALVFLGCFCRKTTRAKRKLNSIACYYQPATFSAPKLNAVSKISLAEIKAV